MTTSVFAFVIVLGVLIFVHEFGHFIVARLCGVGVEKFSLGFGPRVISFRKKETEYRLSLIPLGGYVRLYGEEKATGDPKEFLSRPKWQKLLAACQTQKASGHVDLG